MLTVIFIKINPLKCNMNKYYICFRISKEMSHIQEKVEYNCQISVRSCDRIFGKLSGYYFED